MKLFLLIFCTLITVTGNAQRLVLATYQYAANDRKANIQPLADHIQKSLRIEVEVKSYPTVHLFIEAIQNNEVDIALINTFGYFLLEASTQKFPMKPIAVLKVKKEARDNYKTAFIASGEMEVDTLARPGQVASRSKLLLVSPGSTSGNLVPRLALSSVGLKNPEKDFGSVAYGKNHTLTLDSIANGRDIVGAVGSTEYFKFMKDPVNIKRVKLLWMSPEIPLGPVLIHDKTDPMLRDSLTTLLLELSHANSKALEAVKDGWSEAKQADHYIKIGASYYQPFREQLGDEKTMAGILKQFAN